MTLDEVARAEPIYETFARLERGRQRRAQLRRRCRTTRGATWSASRRWSGVPIDVISVGPDRDETITRRTVF